MLLLFLHFSNFLPCQKEFVVSDYMQDQKQVNQRMRSILVDWLVQVHEKFRLLQETLYLTVAFVDRYLAVSNHLFCIT